jgi:hypothetical protein
MYPTNVTKYFKILVTQGFAMRYLFLDFGQLPSKTTKNQMHQKEF